MDDSNHPNEPPDEPSLPIFPIGDFPVLFSPELPPPAAFPVIDPNASFNPFGHVRPPRDSHHQRDQSERSRQRQSLERSSARFDFDDQFSASSVPSLPSMDLVDFGLSLDSDLCFQPSSCDSSLFFPERALTPESPPVSRPDNTDGSPKAESSPTDSACQDERKSKENMSFFASNVIKVAASSQQTDGTAIDNVLLEVCKRVLSGKLNSECVDEKTEQPESLKRCHDSDREESQERLESVCNASPSLIPTRKVVKHNLGDKVSDASDDASMSLSEEQKGVLEKEGITGEWLARFRMIYNTMVRLNENGAHSSAAISALSTQAQELAQDPTNSDDLQYHRRRRRRRSNDRKMDSSVCSPSKRRRQD